MSITVRQWASLSILIASVMVMSGQAVGAVPQSSSHDHGNASPGQTPFDYSKIAAQVAAGSLPEFPTNLTHFVYIVRENEVFDSYLGDCATTINASCNDGANSPGANDWSDVPYLHQWGKAYSVFDNMYSSIDPYSAQAHAMLFTANTWGATDSCASGGTQGTGSTTEWGVYNSSSVKAGSCSWSGNSGSQSYNSAGGSIFDRFLGTNVPQSKTTIPFASFGDIIWEISSPGCSVASSSGIPGSLPENSVAVEHVTGCSNGWWKNTTSGNPDMPPSVNTATGYPQMLWECQYACAGAAPTPFLDQYVSYSFISYLKDYGLPTYSFIELFDDHPGGNCGQTQTTCIQWNDASMNLIVQDIMNSTSAYKDNTVVAITEDDTQNGQNNPDHINSGRRLPFVMVASHNVMKGTQGLVIHQTFNTSNVLSVMERVEMNVNPNVFLTGGISPNSDAFPMVQNDYLAEGNPLEPLWKCGQTGVPCNTGASSGGPSITAFTAQPSTFVVGNTTYLNATVTGGTAPYSYAYTGLPLGCAAANSPKITCKPSGAGTSTVTLTVTDAASATATNSVSFTATSPTSGPTITSYTASLYTVKVGQTTYLNVTASGGTGSLTYAYTGLPPGCASANTASLPCTPTSVGGGSYTVAVTVTDANSNTATSSLVLSITSNALAISSFAATPGTITPGGTSYFNVTATGGATPYTYGYTGLPAGCSSANTNSLPCKPSATSGTFNVTVTVTDASSASVTAVASLTISVAAPTLTSVRLTPATLTLSTQGTQTFYAVALDQYGNPMTGTVNYQWSLSPASLGTLSSTSGSNTTTLTAGTTAGATGTVTILASQGPPSASKSATISIFGASGTESATSGAAPLTVTFTASPSGGVAPYTYLWTFGNGNTASTQNPSNTYASGGSFSPTVTVTDAQGHTTNIVLPTITVTGGTNPLTVSASGTPLAGAIPLAVQYTGSATGGKPAYSYSWAFGDGGTSALQSPAHTYTTAGSYTAVFSVTDSASTTKTYTLSVTAQPSSAGAVAVAMVASQSSGQAPLAVSFAAAASGGTDDFTSYVWNFGDTNTGSGAQTSHTYQSAGTFPVEVTVTDSAGSRGHAFMNITATAASVPTVSSFTASPASFTLGGTVYLNVSVTGGTAPYSYSYTGLPAGCGSANTPNLVCVPSGTGASSVTVTVTDAKSQTATKVASFTVNPTSTTTSGTPTPWLEYAAIGAAVILAVALIAILATRRKGQKPSPQGYDWSEQPTQGPGTPYYQSPPPPGMVPVQHFSDGLSYLTT